jgi:transcriptional regulator with XRE-family HTH domain
MKYSNKPFPKALKEIMDKKDIIHRKLAIKTNFCFSYFCVLKKREKHPPIETIKKIASGLGIPPEYFLEYRIDKLVKILMDHPTVTDDVIDFTRGLIGDNDLKIADKEKGVFEILPWGC